MTSRQALESEAKSYISKGQQRSISRIAEIK